jgi:DNA-binding NtrC family response regulator
MTYVLLVSKEEQELELLSNELGKGAGITVGKCSSGKEALELVVKNKIDVVVAAEELSDGDGITFIKNLTKKQPLINSALVSVSHLLSSMKQQRA